MSQQPPDKNDPNRERSTGSVKVPDRNRKTGSVPLAGSTKALAEREREETSFTGSAPGVRERVTGSHPQPKPSTPSQAGQERERVTQKMAPPERVTGSHPQPPGAITQPKQLTVHQKEMLSSAFQSTTHRKHVANVVGNTGEHPRGEEEDDEATSLGVSYDGKTPARELTNRDLFKAVQAPVQSREGRRSKNLYEQVIFQFAVGFNPRYEPDGPGKPRAHIFVWDVSRAMNCEVPHFIGTKELSLAQTVDWIRHEGPSRGWTRGNPEECVRAAGTGNLVLALPKEIRLKQVAIVIPQPSDPDGRPRLAGAAVKVGGNLSVYEGLGVYAAEYFIHG